MFCPGCGTENPAQAVYCYKCGAQLPQAIAGGLGFVAPGQLPGPATPAAGYLWGQIHGWSMLIGGPIMFLLFLAVLLAPSSDRQTREGAVLFLVLLALATVTGLGLVRRMPLGLRLVYVWAGLHGVLLVVGVLALLGAPHDTDIHIAFVAILAGSIFWFLCAPYYHRRRGLFH